MKIAPSLKIVLQLAAQEAVSAAFTEIEPEHLLMGLLKFGEIPIRDLRAGPDGPPPIQQLLHDTETLLDRLRSWNIDSTALRRQLRRRLGRGDADAAQRELRRAPASCKLFEEAAVLASETGAAGIAAAHLLDAILTSPTPLIRDLLNSTGGDPRPDSRDDGQRLQLGRDLVPLAAAGQLPAANDRQAEGRAMCGVLGGRPYNNVFGICGSIQGAEACLHALARELHSQAKDAPLVDKRLIELNELLSPSDSPGEILDRLRNVLSEFAESADAIVALRLYDEVQVPLATVWSMVQDALADFHLQLVVLATPGIYDQISTSEPRGLRRMHVMWLRSETAWELGQETPDLRHPGLVDVRHLVCATAMSPRACIELGCATLSKEGAVRRLEAWQMEEVQSPTLDELSRRLRDLRVELLEKVFGQDHAVQAFVEGLFNAEVVADADVHRQTPRAIFAFAGPPGVGKTYLATFGAAALDRPFKRFNMSSYSGHQQHEQLTGEPPVYRGAKPGELTGFVQENPTAVLLFDEIEKASRKTIHLFLQILDAGTLQDQHTGAAVPFRDTIIIFTTNAGRKLYDDRDRAGAMAAGGAFHRQTILSALETEKNPETGEAFFPEAICSRLATGYPVLFNRLGVNELGRVVQAELNRVGQLLERQFKKEVHFSPLVPLTLVLREGAQADARTLRAQAEIFAKTEVFHLCQLFQGDRLEQTLQGVERIRYDVEVAENGGDLEVESLYRLPRKPRILLVADLRLAHTYEDHIGEVEWRLADQPEDALRILSRDDIDLVLVDIWLGGSSAPHMQTVRQFDHAPLGARGLAQGQELLRVIHQRLPEMPVYLLSLESAAVGEDTWLPGPAVDDELLAACVRAGGVRGVITSRLTDSLQADLRQQRDQLVSDLQAVAERTWRETAAARLGKERKVLQFETAPWIDHDRQEIVIRLRKLRLGRALSALDAGEVLADVERPQTTFDQVIGADEAKDELRFFIDILKDPRRPAAMGMKLPKGVLLHGPPGTGKTLLARAMAGESDVAFLPASASNFVTLWQGSGPRSIRDLFARARRYAPAVIFIDEIDAIGKTRTGGPGGKAEENTLNALLTEMDGFTGPSPSRPVFVLAATNFQVDENSDDGGGRASRLDPALVRRFDRAIFVGLPDLAARRRYLALRLLDREEATVDEPAVDLLAERSTGMSVANLEAVIETALRDALRGGHPLTGALLEEALEKTRYGAARPRTPEEKKSLSEFSS